MKTEVLSEGEPLVLCSTKEFKKKYFPNIKENQWNDWKWQLSNSIKSISILKKFVSLHEEENIEGLNLPLRITPYYLSLFYNKEGGLRKTMIPSFYELSKSEGESCDPLDENHDSPIPGLVHRYPDRVLFLVTNSCSANCRYCTRSRIIENKKDERVDYEKIIDYIKRHGEIRDVIVSGGDPLTLSDAKLDYILGSLREISHVEIIRIGTKVPFTLPQRITNDLVNIVKNYHPLFLSIHSTHPDEFSDESKIAISKLADAGIVLGSQTVLLKGVNDNPETLKDLFHGLLKMRIRPYYLYQCDPIIGSHHFKTEVAVGLDIIKSLRGFTSGYAIPQYVIDAPGGGGKIPLVPNSVVSEDVNFLYLQNYEGEIFKYPKN